MTNHWNDLANSDCVLMMGSNPAENHPISFRWVMKAKDNGATLIHVDPRYTRTSTKADIYVPLRSGTDIAFLGGMIKYILDHDKMFKEYAVNYTNIAFVVGDKFDFKDGLFSKLRQGQTRLRSFLLGVCEGRQGGPQARPDPSGRGRIWMRR